MSASGAGWSASAAGQIVTATYAGSLLPASGATSGNDYLINNNNGGINNGRGGNDPFGNNNNNDPFNRNANGRGGPFGGEGV